jgi:DNA invertase Pin-like site-specific DNA recombinase
MIAKIQKKAAIIYTRFSPRRNAAECESLDTQFEICTAYCKIHDMAVLGSYEDEAISGKNAIDRAGLQNAVDHAVRVKGVLVFYSLSRLARSVRDALAIADRLKEGKADLCSVKESFDTSTPMGKCIYTIMSAFNELERNKISEYTKDAMLRHQSTGRRMSAILPYGWRDDPDDPARMLPDEHELEVIDVIMDLREDGHDINTGEDASGLSYRDICLELLREGYEPRPITREIDGKKVETAGKWHANTIRRIVSRRKSDTS